MPSQECKKFGCLTNEMEVPHEPVSSHCCHRLVARGMGPAVLRIRRHRIPTLPLAPTRRSHRSTTSRRGARTRRHPETPPTWPHLPASVPLPIPSAPSTASEPAGVRPVTGRFCDTVVPEEHSSDRSRWRHHSIDAVITLDSVIGPNQRFRLATVQPDYTTIKPAADAS